MPALPTYSTSILTVQGATSVHRLDELAIEEPLEIRLGYGPANDRQRANVAVTMRTPGHDSELAVGYLVAEGLVANVHDILAVVPVNANVIRVDLRPGVWVEMDRLQRHGVMASSCGLCGKTTLDALERDLEPIASAEPRIPASVVHGLPRKLREAQATFSLTGGLHAVARFDRHGTLLALREDVGRHNAMDKLLGQEFLAGRFPLHDNILFVSARASFELVQKAAVAGIAIFAAVGAPSSLAVQTAERFGITLLGFVRDERFNIYAGAERIRLDEETTD